MKPTDSIIIAILLIIVALATVYIIKAKCKGNKCIGCPYCSACSQKNANFTGGCCNTKHTK